MDKNGQTWLRKRTVVYNPVPKLPDPPFRIPLLGGLWRLTRRLCTVLGAIVLFFIVLGIWSASQVSEPPVPRLPEKIVLSFHLDGRLPESPGVARYLSRLGLGEDVMTLRDVVDSIDAGARDPKVKALTFYLSSNGYELTQLQEIRAAVLRFKHTKKPTMVYASSYGDGGMGLGMYYLASAFDQIWMQPVGVVSIAGISAEMPFFRNLMDTYGVRPEFFQRKEYKTVMESMTSSSMSEPSKRMMRELITDMGEQVVEAVATDRKKISSPENFRSLMDLALITDKVALKEGLVDRLDYEDVFRAEAEQKIAGGGDSKEIEGSHYWAAQSLEGIEKRILEKATHKPSLSVALIYVEGTIEEDEEGAPSPYEMGEGAAAGARQIAQAIHDAASEKDIRGIVIRIDSPGGSPVASETIYRAIVEAQEVHKKPVWVSMGASAASGGYWIAAPAERIYALGTTLTGSIGVAGGKVDASGLMEKVGVTWDGVSFGENAGMGSFVRPFSPAAQRQFEASLDNVYDHFVGRVAKGRKMTPEQVEVIAKGRVWTGRQAQKLGLVDVLGGLDRALDDMAQKMGGKDRRDLTIASLPKKNSPADIFYALLDRGVLSHIPLLSFLREPGGVKGAPSRLVYDPVRLRG